MASEMLCRLCRLIFAAPWAAECDIAQDAVEAGTVEAVNQYRSASDVQSDSDSQAESIHDDEDFYERADWVQVVRPKTTKDPAEYKTPLHHDIKALEKSAAEGCHLCSLLWDIVQTRIEEVRPDLNELSHAVGSVVIRPDISDEHQDSSSCFEKLEMDVSYFKNGENKRSDMYLFTASLALWPSDTNWGLVAECLWPHGRLAVSSAQAAHTRTELEGLSSHTLSQLSTFVQDCLCAHAVSTPDLANSSGMPGNHFLPTRLLDLGTPFGPHKIALRSSTTLDPDCQYITLSHCWGRNLPRLRLLQENFEQLIDEIPLESLPKTFRHAVQVTRALGVRYLWIDSLCIVQDSRSDWDQEAHRMAAVYSQALVNLAATFAMNSEGGLVGKRDTLLTTPCQVDCRVSGCDRSSFLIIDEDAWRRRVDGAPLNSRAWVLQERLLATRTIHFASDQVWWECGHSKACETFPMGLPYNDSLSVPTDFTMLETLRNKTGEETANDFWLPIVTAYSRCNLTFASDKLIALAGLAQTIQKHLLLRDSDYLAGLWQADICVDLLWRLRAAGSRYDEYVAPSWSWASVKGQVYFNDDDSRTVIRNNLRVRVVESSTISASKSKLGSLTGGSLILEGDLYAIALSGFELDDPQYPRATRLALGSAEWKDGQNFGEALDDDSLYVNHAQSNLDVTMLLFMTTTTPYLLEDFMSEGLIIRPTGTCQGEYQRIGWIRIFHAVERAIERETLAHCTRDCYLRSNERAIRLV